MLDLTAQGDLFAANAEAGFDEGYVAVNVGAGIRGSFGASAEFCHGYVASVMLQSGLFKRDGASSGQASG